MAEQAREILTCRFLDLSSEKPRTRVGEPTGKIRSLSTLQCYSRALGQAGIWVHKKHGLLDLNALTPGIAFDYLEHRIADGIGQKQIDNDRAAMQFIPGKLERIKTGDEQQPDSKSAIYTALQVEMIASRQDDHNALATRIAFDAGLYAQELLTLRRVDEAEPTTPLQCRSDLFHGRSGKRYVVKGRRGVPRQVLLSHELANALEKCRLDKPRTVRDRGAILEVCYGIGGGRTWSNGFSKRSKRELKWSIGGALGLRRTFAYERRERLQDLGYLFRDAEDLVAQEIGNFGEGS